MIKTVLHIVVAVSIWFALSHFSAYIGIKIAGIVSGALLVHLFWERFVIWPQVYFGARPVSNDDPLMREAIEKALAAFPKFLQIFPDHKSDSTVRFRFETDSGGFENLWGDLIGIDDKEAKIYLRTPPVEHKGRLERRMTIRLDQINDWQVEFPDGTLRGGYTNLATFKIFEREEGRPHPGMLEHYQRFKEIDW